MRRSAYLEWLLDYCNDIMQQNTIKYFNFIKLSSAYSIVNVH